MNSVNDPCPLCEPCQDTQLHISQCQILQDMLPPHSFVQYSDLFGNIHQQKRLTDSFDKNLNLRDELLIDDPASQSSLPGLHTGPQLPQARTCAESSTCDVI